MMSQCGKWQWWMPLILVCVGGEPLRITVMPQKVTRMMVVPERVIEPMPVVV